MSDEDYYIGIRVDETVYHAEQIKKSYQEFGKEFKLTFKCLCLRRNEITGVLGPNGSGKTTLLRIVAGEIAADSGSITYPSISGASLDWPTIRQAISYVPQRIQKWHGRLEHCLHYWAGERKITGAHNEDEVDYLIHRTGLNRYRNHRWNQLSGGTLMRVELARARLGRPKLFVLDEPLAPLDVLEQSRFMQDIRDVANEPNEPVAVLISSQHLFEVEVASHQVLVLEEGRVAHCFRPASSQLMHESNCFELSINFPSDEFLQIVRGLNATRIEKLGNKYIVWTPKELTGKDFLQAILGQGDAPNYFRDISLSARRLFNPDVEQI